MCQKMANQITRDLVGYQRMVLVPACFDNFDRKFNMSESSVFAL